MTCHYCGETYPVTTTVGLMEICEGCLDAPEVKEIVAELEQETERADEHERDYLGVK